MWRHLPCQATLTKQVERPCPISHFPCLCERVKIVSQSQLTFLLGQQVDASHSCHWKTSCSGTTMTESESTLTKWRAYPLTKLWTLRFSTAQKPSARKKKQLRGVALDSHQNNKKECSVGRRRPKIKAHTGAIRVTWVLWLTSSSTL